MGEEVGRGKLVDFQKRRLRQLEEENASLKAYTAEMVARVRENEALYRKLFALEAEALAAADAESACFAVLRGLRARFALDFVRLWLIRGGMLAGVTLEAISERDVVWIEAEELAAMGIGAQRPVRLLQPKKVADFPWAVPEVEGLGSLAVVCLGDPAQAVGALGLGSVERERFAPGLATDFLEHLGRVIGLVLAHSAARARVAMLSVRDPATGLYRARFLQARANKPVGDWFAEGAACVALNCRMGEDAPLSDAMLEAIAAAIRQPIRRTDPVVRERAGRFFVFLPGCSGERAMKLARAIVDAVAKAAEGVQAAAGVAEAGADETVAALVERAERAMFVAEALGDGRVERMQ